MVWTGVWFDSHFSGRQRDRKSTRLNSSHVANSYAVFCLKKKKSLDRKDISCGRAFPRPSKRRRAVHLCCDWPVGGFIFFFNDTATPEIYTLSLHDALPIYLMVKQFVFIFGISRQIGQFVRVALQIIELFLRAGRFEIALIKGRSKLPAASEFLNGTPCG